jgi:lipopolysaccharide biosynthesis protein
MYGKKEGRLPNPSGLLVGEDAQTTQDPELLSREEENLFARIREHGGLSGIVSKAMWTLRRRGFGSLVEQIRKELTRGKVATSKLEPEMAFALEYRVVPYYLKHYFAAPKTSPENSPRIAIHLHLENPDQAQDFGKYLANVPVPFTLFVSIPDGEEQVTHWVQTTLPMVKEMRVTITPTHARKLVPFVVEFDKKLSQYDVVAHLHKFDEDFDEVMSNLFGAAEIIHQILQLLQQDACFVYSSQKGNKLDHGQVWDDIHPTIQKLAEKYWKQFPEKDARVEFPQGGVFWAKSIALEKFLALPVKYESFSEEAYVDLEKLLLVSAKGQPGRNYRLHSPHTDSVSPAYENENDYSDRIVHNSVKVLSYYLPQFYPIPENDEWHGNGFTEWNKVRNTTPLFYGHDQQRAPHDDIGYYSLITTDVLRQQSQWMKQVGVAGQIFYHYWFTGKLILEKPAQMLLADLGIDMPFCFCWANENWTRRWDGNEREILLKQDYSAEDAASFINYLIPFFRDKRYITIEGRPVLFIYRPSSIPDYALYKRIWNDLCAQNGLPNPYVVAILTRGAASPVEFDMDAGCERVLHDWTDNAVPNIKDDLHKYWDLNGSVLDYNAVADYYMAQPPLEDFTYFRSLIPTWDNSPRYGSDAYLIHNSTPGKFQQWLEHLVQDAETRLPYDRRFVIVNAWNEWAESAILDPDKKHGYAYLNSIGRALSDIPYEGREYLHQQIPRDVTISLSLSERAFDTLQNDPEQRRKFFACLAQSSLFEKCRLMFAQPQVAEWFEEMYPASNIEKEAKDGGQFEIHLKQVCYFSPAALEPMLQMALCYNAGMVIPTVLNDAAFTHAGLSTNWEWNGSVDDLPLILLNKNGNNLVKCCVDAGVFITLPSSNSNAISEPVSTIIRFHRSGDMKLLQNALYSLLAQTDCVVQPVLAVQDLPEPMLAELQTMLEKIPFHNKYAPKVKRYQSDASCSDLRSLMLNQELKLVRTQFASFLDYDDILFAGAFSWLITRLKKTGKNASFGLIYSTSVTWEENRINKRSAVYNYGKSYKDFYNNNHTPIHGFMLDVTRINLLDLEYVRCMKYMEDYYLTLQIFTENDTDWNSLQEGKFIGDYYHYEDKVQTLANIDQDQRIKLISLPEYAKCEENIQLLRQKKRRYNR